MNTELPTLPDSAEDLLIFRENKPIQVHKFDNLPDTGNFLSIRLYVIYRIVSNKRSPSNKRPPNLFSNKTR